MDSKVYVNEQFVGRIQMANAFFLWYYSLFECGWKQNTIAVHVVNQQPSSRWYSGGIYRRMLSWRCNGQGSFSAVWDYDYDPQLEKQQNGAVDAVVKSRIVNQDDPSS